MRVKPAVFDRNEGVDEVRRQLVDGESIPLETPRAAKTCPSAAVRTIAAAVGSAMPPPASGSVKAQ